MKCTPHFVDLPLGLARKKMPYPFNRNVICENDTNEEALHGMKISHAK